MTYSKNIGFQEMIEFYEKASAPEIEEMENLAGRNDWNGYKVLIRRVLGINLK